MTGVDQLGPMDDEDALRMYLRKVEGLPLLTPSEEMALLREAEGDPGRMRQAQERLCMGNLRLAVSVATKYTGRGLSLTDLIRAGNTGLVRAVMNYDHRKGHGFSTYAVRWIRQAIVRALRDQSSGACQEREQG